MHVSSYCDNVQPRWPKHCPGNDVADKAWKAASTKCTAQTQKERNTREHTIHHHHHHQSKSNNTITATIQHQAGVHATHLRYWQNAPATKQPKRRLRRSFRNEKSSRRLVVSDGRASTNLPSKYNSAGTRGEHVCTERGRERGRV